MLDLKIIQAISLDLDDTLWPVWPVIERAEKALETWLGTHAPMAAALFANSSARADIRASVLRSRPDLKHDLSAVRREAIRVALQRSKEDPALAEAAFDVFFAERNRVMLYDDALLALEFLASRFPVVALSNGNADVQRIGLGRYFSASISAQEFGVGKPDARIFHAAAGAVDVEVKNVLHIGDDATLDVMGALSAGMQAAWLNRTGDKWQFEAMPSIMVANLTQLCDELGQVEKMAA